MFRVVVGLEFLWAFLDKTFGLGYATPSARAWINGGSPTKGFLSSVEGGPLQSLFHAIAGTWWANGLFRLGLLAIGGAPAGPSRALPVVELVEVGPGAVKAVPVSAEPSRRTARALPITR